MESKIIIRSEEFTENTACNYWIPNMSTIEKLSMAITAGEGAVLRFNDRVLVTDRTRGGFIAAVYEFVDDAQEMGLDENECRLNLIAMSEELFADGGHAIMWAAAQ